METFLIRALQLIMSLSLLVIIHEGGHFLFSRLFKVRVEKFYIFFDPWFSLFKFKPKNSDTEYGVGWVPLGGYVKISGMIDESMDTEQMKQPAQPWEFRSKPAWQRLLIMIGGVLMNFLLAIFIYSMILFHWGDSYISLQDMTYGMKFNERAQEIGFRDGDILLRADEQPLERFGMDMLRNVAEARTVTVLRDGKETEIYMPEISLLDIAKEEPMFLDILRPNVVDSVIAGGPLAIAGVQKGDSILAVNNMPVGSWNEFTEKLEGFRSDAETNGAEYAEFSLVYSHQGMRDTVAVRTDSLFMVRATSMLDYKVTTRHFNFFESSTIVINPYNKRIDYLEYKVVRGNILAADGQILAETDIDEDGNEIASEGGFGDDSIGKDGALTEHNQYRTAELPDTLTFLVRNCMTKKVPGTVTVKRQ